MTPFLLFCKKNKKETCSCGALKSGVFFLFFKIPANFAFLLKSKITS